MTVPVTFEDSVKERLKSIVADLIPEEKWENIVRSTILEFETKDLPALIKAELTEQYKTAIRAKFAKQEWQSKWTGVGQEASPIVRQMLIDAAPAILAQMIGSAAQQTLYNLNSQVQRY